MAIKNLKKSWIRISKTAFLAVLLFLCRGLFMSIKSCKDHAYFDERYLTLFKRGNAIIVWEVKIWQKQ